MTLSPGARLGPYEIVAKLGAGGMGEVWRARDTRLGREVAVKVLPESVSADPDRIRRFELEARAAGMLSHPNVASVFDVGIQDAIPYVVSELLEGETLREKLASGALFPRQAVDYATQIAHGLAAAHEKGIVHRDLKPENLFVTEDGRVKILDLGLAKLTRAEGGTQTEAPTEPPATTPGIVLGTVGYMSPEQVRGRPTDARSDIFSLGAVFYEMLSGERAFRGESPPEVLSAILTKEPLDPAFDHSQIDPDLARIVRRTLEKDPAHRFHSARDLALDLAAWRGGASSSTGVSPGRRLRRGWFVAAAAVVALASAAIWMATRHQVIQSLAVLPFVNASGDPNAEYLSDGITESLINSLAQLPNVSVVSRNSVFRFKGREMDAETAGRELKVQAVLTGRVVRHGDDLSISAELADTRNNGHLWGERYDRKFSDLLAIQSEIVRDISSELKARLTGEEKTRLNRQFTQNTEAYDLYLKGRYLWNKRNVEDLKKGIEYFRLAIDRDPSYGLAYSGLADSYGVMPVYGFPPREAFAQARAAAQKALEVDSSLAQPHAVLAVVYESFWDFPAAEREYRRAIELDPKYPTAHHWYSLFLFYMGRPEEGIREAKRAYELDPLSLIINNLQTMVSYYTRRFDEAVERARKTLDLDKNFPPAHLWMGNTLARTKQFPEAITELQEAVRLIGHRNEALSALGYAYAISGKKQEALGVIEELKKWPEEGYDPTIHIAMVYAGLGENDEAMRWLEKAFQEHSTWFIQLGLKVDARWDSLRDDPRFSDLLKRIGFPV